MSIKLEALFKLDYIIEKNNEKDIRNFLESKIDSLEVHHIETFVTPNVTKAIITSNLKFLLRCKTSLFEEVHSLVKKITGMDNVKITGEQIYQDHINQMSKRITELQETQERLFHENKAMIERIANLTISLSDSTKIGGSLKKMGEISYEKVEEMQKKLFKQETIFKEEREVMQVNLDQLSAKLISLIEENKKLKEEIDLYKQINSKISLNEGNAKELEVTELKKIIEECKAENAKYKEELDMVKMLNTELKTRIHERDLQLSQLFRKK